MKKRIVVNQNDIIEVGTTLGYAGDKLEIFRSYRMGSTIKNIDFSLWDDIAFNAYTTEEADSLEFIFNINDPFYFCLNRFLGTDKEICIDDDDTHYYGKKYMLIRKEGYSIKIIFKNLLSEEDYDPTEYLAAYFRVFIKNIGPDARSKIEDYDIKVRIVNFLRDCGESLLEEYHQITIDEYLETLHYYQECQKANQKIIRRN